MEEFGEEVSVRGGGGAGDKLGRGGRGGGGLQKGKEGLRGISSQSVFLLWRRMPTSSALSALVCSMVYLLGPRAVPREAQGVCGR